MKKILFIFLLVTMLFFISCSKPSDNKEETKEPEKKIEDIIIDKKDKEDPVEHRCNHICLICGKCTDLDCKDPSCSEKCPGHNEEPSAHECNHVCPVCGKCLDNDCTDPACADKCSGHNEEPPVHVCNHICPECGKCLDNDCTDPVCAEKCPGHTPITPTHECNHVCPECGKCLDNDCTDPVCTEKCPGHTPITPTHECGYVCPECGKCLDNDCTDPVCAEKCLGHIVKPVIEEINEIYVSFRSSDLAYSSTNDAVTIKLESTERLYNAEKNKDYIEYTLIITTDDLHKFSEELIFHWQKEEDEALNALSYDVIDNTLYFYTIMYYNVLLEVKVYLDTTKYTVAYDSNDYTAELKKPFDYIYIYTLIKFKLEPSVAFKFIVNDKEIASNKYTIEKTNDGYLLTYRIDDPNWTPYY